MAPAEQSPDHAYTIGYALQPSKVGSVIQPPLVALAAERGMRLVAIDASRPLADQGPFHLIVHKLYDRPWRAQLEAFSALHPSVPVLDPPTAIDRLLDRASMLDVVPGLGVPGVGVPRQVAVRDAAALAEPDLMLAAAGLRFPLIAKPLAVDGSAASHAMSLVYRREGLRGLQLPVMLQEFVNHGGVLFKVYVMGDGATCVRRRSLPDVRAERLLLADDLVPFANVSSLPPPEDAGDADTTTMSPTAGFVEEVARGLRRALGLNLFNFDMIRGESGRYYLIDINYFPGYAKMPGYEIALTEFFAKTLDLQIDLPQLENTAPSLDCKVQELEFAQPEIFSSYVSRAAKGF
ncbi:inositol-tetrakisphosphate 1-kinase 4-like [Lolium rigidum]|uniref:inositol-tetrakisphosphate 1-kinase 4-like n=1 Tax=Lolium rigidum TaxID=89674 RepID=UPI001F5C654F|nr:inositol-tetrakisphosphate 1-kinase 4-like [Lolium rigidum]